MPNVTILSEHHTKCWRRVLHSVNSSVLNSLIKENVRAFKHPGLHASEYIVKNNHEIIMLCDGGIVSTALRNGVISKVQHERATTIML